MPPADQVREELDRIVSSGVFARSGRARDLLQYVIEQDLAGQADRLKGFSIAVDVFGKPDTFDPSHDTVVRVQAGRLRELLDRYYEEPGAAGAIRISIPRGGYAPEYTDMSDSGGCETDETHGLVVGEGEARIAALASPPVRPRRWMHHQAMLAGGVFAAALIAGLSLGAYWPAAYPFDVLAGSSVDRVTIGSHPDTTGTVRRELLPSVYLAAEADEASQRVAALLRRGTAGFDTVNLIARQPTPNVPGAHRRTDFVFDIRAHGRRGAMMEVRNLVSGKVLLSKVFDTHGHDGGALDDQIADFLSSVVPVSGAIYASLTEDGARTPLIHCLVLSEQFYREQRASSHRTAYECLEDLAAHGSVSPLVYSELAALHHRSVRAGYGYPENATAERALELARQAIQLGPNSPYAHRAMGFVLPRNASSQEATRWSRKASELNPFDLGMAASYGYALIFAGEFDEGTPILERAVNAASAHPTWWDYGLFLGHFMQGNLGEAADALSPLAASERAHYIAARLITASALGQEDVAAPLRAELLARHHVFVSDPLSFYMSADYPQEICERLTAALRNAGIGGAS